jgi:hypothetical protein
LSSAEGEQSCPKKMFFFVCREERLMAPSLNVNFDISSKRLGAIQEIGDEFLSTRRGESSGRDDKLTLDMTSRLTEISFSDRLQLEVDMRLCKDQHRSANIENKASQQGLLTNRNDRLMSSVSMSRISSMSTSTASFCNDDRREKIQNEMRTAA